MTERGVIFAVALLLVGLCMLAMAGLHERHYKGRKFQLLQARVEALEKMMLGEHDA